MIRRLVWTALAQGVDAGDDEAARRVIARGDRLVRGLARRRLERCLFRAYVEVGELAGADQEGMRHVLRLASLELNGRTAMDARDPVAVATAYAALPPAPPPMRWPLASLGAGLLVVLLLGLALWATPALIDRGRGASKAFTLPAPPPSAGAFAEGGVPLSDPRIERLLGDELTDFQLALDRIANGAADDPAYRAELRAVLLGPDVATVMGPELSAAWAALLADLERWALLDATVEAEQVEAVSNGLLARAAAVSDHLAARSLGYYLDPSLWTQGDARHAILYTYRVERVAHVRAGDQRRRVLSLRRLDRINLRRALLGMQAEHLRDPVVMLDQIDDHVAQDLLPTLAGAVDAAIDDEWGEGELARVVYQRGGELARAALTPALGEDGPALASVATAMAERRVLVAQWQVVLERMDRRLRPIDTVLLPEGWLTSIDRLLPPDEVAAAQAIERRLVTAQAPRVAARVAELVAATVRRHEAQHGLDEGQPLAYPPVLEELLGPETSEDEFGETSERRRAVSAKAELSAYLSEIAANPLSPHLDVLELARHALGKGGWGRTESYVAVVVVGELARELGVALTGELIHDRAIDRDVMGAALLAVFDAPADRVRAAAAAAWSRLFARPYVPVVDEPVAAAAPAR